MCVTNDWVQNLQNISKFNMSKGFSPDTGVKTPSSNLSSPEDLSSKFGSENEMGAGVQI